MQERFEGNTNHEAEVMLYVSSQSDLLDLYNWSSLLEEAWIYLYRY